MRVALSQAQVLSVLAALHDVEDRKMSALKGRVEHLLRLKYPPGLNTGKGRRASYDAPALFRLVLIFELCQLGLSQERSVQILKAMPQAVVAAASYGARAISRGLVPPPSEDENFILSLFPTSLINLTAYDDSNDPEYQALLDLPTVWWSVESELDTQFGRRISRINVTTLLVWLSVELEERGTPASEFAADLWEWAESYGFEPADGIAYGSPREPEENVSPP